MDDAIRILKDPNSSPEVLESMLKRLYFSPYANDNIVRIYNIIEEKWKSAVNYKTNEE